MQVHNLLFTDYENCESPGVVGIIGQCSCSAWFELRVDKPSTQLVVAVRQNGFPPCPAVCPLADHFQEEIEDAK